ncbi:ABC transporter substrate-binding protein [Pseudoalteromonas sp. SCSIO 43201]|uniref:ABC transporter substrate-binding protein n=1 Tax=Pseudoalteromonas sp. SCSIO 43201 TaxID=2822842 RepID=UPI0020758C8C|nr:ABC transporter substrate-binding protein [Pseudoalteromonas sp. SCSIO 43201]USD30403.1 ABC transporter substrate-binding protein [Pseudoalteromonas sp. SCSIO 43201]
MNTLRCKRVALGGLLYLCGGFFAHAEPVRIIVNDWASQLVVSNIYASLLKHAGIQSQFISLPTVGQWYYLKYNHADVQVEVWQGTMEDKLEQLLHSGDIQQAGTYPISTREEWWYPDYVAKLCPKLPDWRALNDCVHLFSEGGDPRGVYYNGPWEKNDSARIRALNLNYRVENLPDDFSLVRVLKDAYKNKKPILIFNWTPNWVEARYAGYFVEFPPYTIECGTQPQWGINKDFLHDCGNPRDGWIKKIASSAFVRSQPCAFAILQSMTFNSDDLAQFALQVNINAKTNEKASEMWLKRYQSRWQSWLKHPSCQIYRYSQK